MYVFDVLFLLKLCIRAMCSCSTKRVPHKRRPSARAPAPVGAVLVTAAVPLLKDVCGTVLQSTDAKPCCGALLWSIAPYRLPIAQAKRKRNVARIYRILIVTYTLFIHMCIYIYIYVYIYI